VTITNGYATLNEAKAFLGITDSVDDGIIERSVESASRTIDRMTNRRFYQDAVATARYYRATNPYFVIVDDISTTTSLDVDVDIPGDGQYATQFVLNTDYIMDPQNASSLGRPWTQITRVGSQAIPVCTSNLRPTVRITARWGWPAVPVDIVEATLILTADLFKRKDAVGGVLGISDLGGVRMGALGRDIAAIVRPYRREVLG